MKFEILERTGTASYIKIHSEGEIEDAIGLARTLKELTIKEFAKPANGGEAPKEELEKEFGGKLDVKCIHCNTPTWDNRENKQSTKSPHFKCMNVACAAGCWIQKDGELKWGEPNPKKKKGAE